MLTVTAKDKTETLFDAQRMTVALTRWVELDTKVKNYDHAEDGDGLALLLATRNAARAEFENLLSTFNQSAQAILDEDTYLDGVD